MDRNQFIETLNQYTAGSFITPEEFPSVKSIIDFAHGNPRCFERDNPGHITGSAWVINYDHSKVLLTHHKKLNIWLQLGGHAEGSADIAAVALQEAIEESGIENLTLLVPEIYDVSIHAIPGKCIKHYDIRYLVVAPENSTYKVSHESHDLAWVHLKKIEEYSQERSILRMAEKMKLVKRT